MTNKHISVTVVEMNIGLHRPRFHLSLFNTRCRLFCTGQHTNSETESTDSCDALLSQISNPDDDVDGWNSEVPCCEGSRIDLFGASIDLGEETGETCTETYVDGAVCAGTTRSRSLDELELEWYGKQAKINEQDKLKRVCTPTEGDGLSKKAHIDTSGTDLCTASTSTADLGIPPNERNNYLDGDYVFNFERQCGFNNLIGRPLAPWTSSRTAPLIECDNSDNVTTRTTNCRVDGSAQLRALFQHTDNTDELSTFSSTFDLDNEHTHSDRVVSYSSEFTSYESNDNKQETLNIEPSIPSECSSELRSLLRTGILNREVLASRHWNQTDACDQSDAYDHMESNQNHETFHEEPDSSEHTEEELETDNRIVDDESSDESECMDLNDFFSLCEHELLLLNSSVNAITESLSSPSQHIHTSESEWEHSTVSTISTLSSIDTVEYERFQRLNSQTQMPLFNRPALMTSSNFLPRHHQPLRHHEPPRQRHVSQNNDQESNSQTFESICAELPPLSNSNEDNGSRSSTLNSRSSSNLSGDSTRGVQQQWYFYDPRLVNSARTQRIEVASRHRGQTSEFSVAGIVQPPSYDEVGDANVSTNPPPYDPSISRTTQDIFPYDPPPMYLIDSQTEAIIIPDQNIRPPSYTPGSAASFDAQMISTPCVETSYSYPPPTYRSTAECSRPSLSNVWSEESTGSDQNSNMNTSYSERGISNTSDLVLSSEDLTSIPSENTEDSEQGSESLIFVEDMFDLSTPQNICGLEAIASDSHQNVEDISSERVEDVALNEENPNEQSSVEVIEDDNISVGSLLADEDESTGSYLSHSLRRYPAGSVLGRRPVLRWTGAVSGRRINTTQNWFL